MCDIIKQGILNNSVFLYLFVFRVFLKNCVA
jgi:hypothetical protein